MNWALYEIRSMFFTAFDSISSTALEIEVLSFAVNQFRKKTEDHSNQEALRPIRCLNFMNQNPEIDGRYFSIAENRNHRSGLKKIRNQKSEIRNRKSEIAKRKTENRKRKSEIRNPKSEIQNSKSEIKNRKREIRNQKSEIRNQKSEIKNQKSEIKNPSVQRHVAWRHNLAT